MPESAALINLEALAKPVETLIARLSDGIQGCFAPYQVKRMAAAEIDAERIRVLGAINTESLASRAQHSALADQMRRQNNLDMVGQQASRLLSDDSNPSIIDDDWLAIFKNHAGFVSDEDLQGMWSRVLAGEANVSGCCSKRTLHLLAQMDKEDANLFAKLLQFVVCIGDQLAPIVSKSEPIYSCAGLAGSDLIHLESIGLIGHQGLLTYSLVEIPAKFEIKYFDQTMKFHLPAYLSGKLSIGEVILTKPGEELARLFLNTQQPIEGFIQHMLTYLAQMNTGLTLV